jgi:tetratricopeptide (TPR) repeat protein
MKMKAIATLISSNMEMVGMKNGFHTIGESDITTDILTNMVSKLVTNEFEIDAEHRSNRIKIVVHDVDDSGKKGRLEYIFESTEVAEVFMDRLNEVFETEENKFYGEGEYVQFPSDDDFEMDNDQEPHRILKNDTNIISIHDYKINSKDDGYKSQMIGFELYKQGNVEEAEAYLLDAVKKEFNAPALYDKLAILYRKQKRYKEEVQILELGINIMDKYKTQGAKVPKLKERLNKAKELYERNK